MSIEMNASVVLSLNSINAGICCVAGTFWSRMVARVRPDSLRFAVTFRVKPVLFWIRTLFYLNCTWAFRPERIFFPKVVTKSLPGWPFPLPFSNSSAPDTPVVVEPLTVDTGGTSRLGEWA